MSNTTFVGSKEKSQTSRGTNQDQTGSFTREKNLAPIKNFGVPNPSADPDDWQTRDLNVKTAKSEQPVPVHNGMKANNGSPVLSKPSRPVTTRG